MWSKGCLLFWDKKQVPWSLCQEKWSGIGSTQIMDWSGSLNVLTEKQRTKLPSLCQWSLFWPCGTLPASLFFVLWAEDVRQAALCWAQFTPRLLTATTPEGCRVLSLLRCWQWPLASHLPPGALKWCHSTLLTGTPTCHLSDLGVYITSLISMPFLFQFTVED